MGKADFGDSRKTTIEDGFFFLSSPEVDKQTTKLGCVLISMVIIIILHSQKKNGVLPCTIASDRVERGWMKTFPHDCDKVARLHGMSFSECPAQSEETQKQKQ